MPRPWLRLLDPNLHDLKQSAEDKVPSRLELARALNGRCLHEEARAVIEKTLESHRADADLWFERIMAQGDQASPEDLEDLSQELEAILSENPGGAAILRDLGFVRILQQREAEASKALQASLEANGADYRALELMGLLCIQRDQAADAKSWLLKALSLHPRGSRSLRLLGIACEALGDFKSAETQFLAALEVDPAYFWGWHSLGELLLKRGDMEDGLRCINRARSLQPKEPASSFILAELFAEQGHLDLAQAELHRLTSLAPPRTVLAEAYALLGELRRDAGSAEEATSYFTLAAETDPEAAGPWAALGDLAREDNRWQDALDCYKEALRRQPEAADLQVQLGYTLLNLGQYEESEQVFLAALSSDPGEYSAYLGLSECYRHLQRSGDQLGMVGKAMALAPEDPDVWNAQGVALEVAGQPQAATEAYERALSLAPLHRKAANNLGFLLEKRMQAGEVDLHERAILAWRRRLLICRDEGQSLKMATEHLAKLGVAEDTILRWLDHEPTPGS